ncbi:uncharacterized protein V1510DRAFT_431613 [Dipodascopsis tothii]|uniref:uncharacterized protein n=1 Tax=Dipodascopsis tothii TaxID=44089 RepID=UPI0034CD28D3
MPRSDLATASEHSSADGIVQLGMLYDSRTDQLMKGFSLWKAADLDETKVPAVDRSSYEYSYQLFQGNLVYSKDLDLQAGLGVTVQTVKISSSVGYSRDTSKSANEVHVCVSCQWARKAFTIPEGTRVAIAYRDHLSSVRFTHYVSEIVTGSRALLVFTLESATAEDAKSLKTKLEADISGLPCNASSIASYISKTSSAYKSIRTTYVGTTPTTANTLDDALKAAQALPAALEKEETVLKYTLTALPAEAAYYKVAEDDGLFDVSNDLIQTAEAICTRLDELSAKADDVSGTQTRAHLLAPVEELRQILQSLTANFRKSTATSLSVLLCEPSKDNRKTAVAAVQSEIGSFRKQLEVANQFSHLLAQDLDMLRATVRDLELQKMADCSADLGGQSLATRSRPLVLLALSGDWETRYGFAAALNTAEPKIGHVERLENMTLKVAEASRTIFDLKERQSIAIGFACFNTAFGSNKTSITMKTGDLGILFDGELQVLGLNDIESATRIVVEKYEKWQKGFFAKIREVKMGHIASYDDGIVFTSSSDSDIWDLDDGQAA